MSDLEPILHSQPASSPPAGSTEPLSKQDTPSLESPIYQAPRNTPVRSLPRRSAGLDLPPVLPETEGPATSAQSIHTLHKEAQALLSMMIDKVEKGEKESAELRSSLADERKARGVAETKLAMAELRLASGDDARRKQATQIAELEKGVEMLQAALKSEKTQTHRSELADSLEVLAKSMRLSSGV